ncbi:MAG: hypothetical protein VZR95_10015, partial [Alphaproteobacteria bacterium]
PRHYHATAFTAISLEAIQAHKMTVSTWVHCVTSRAVSAMYFAAGLFLAGLGFLCVHPDN